MRNIFIWLNRPKVAISIFGFLYIAILVAAFLNYEKRKSEIINNIKTELKTIAELKSSEISTWFNERISDSKVLTQGYFLSNRLDNYIKYNKNDDYVNIYEKISTVKKYYKYDDILILDTSKHILVSTNPNLKEFSDETKKVIDELKNNEINYAVYKCSLCEKIHLDFLSPIHNSKKVLIGYALLRTNPNNYLFPLINQWPTQSNTAETIIVQEISDSVIFINDVRHRYNANSKIKIPLTRNEIVAVKVLKGRIGIIEGLDYRNVKVLAYALPIKYSNWDMIAKIDQDEIYRPVNNLYINYGIVASLLLLFLVSIILLIRNTYQKSFIKRLYDNEIERKALANHYEYIIKNANDIIILANSKGDILEANDAAIKAYQIPKDDIKNYHLRKLGFFRFFNNKKSQGIYESIHFRADGTTFPVEINEQSITIKGTTFFQAIIRDITEQSSTYAKLNSSEELHRILFDNNPLPMCVYDIETLKFLKVNDTACEKYGYTRNELLKMNIGDILQKEGVNKVMKNLKANKENNILYSPDCEHQLKSGEVITVDTHSHAFNYEGKQARIVAVIDVTEKKKAKIELEKNQQFLSNIIDNSGSLIYVKDIDGKYLKVNKRWSEYTGYSQAEVLDKNDIDLLGTEKGLKFIENDKKVLSSGNTLELNEELDTKHGSFSFISIKFPLKDTNGNIIGLCGMSTDITKHKQAENEIKRNEEKYRSLVESSDAAITMIDANGYFTYINNVATKPLRLSPDEIIGKSVHEIFPSDSAKETIANIKRIINTNAGYIKETTINSLGKQYWYKTSMQPVRDEDGKPYAILMFATDITELKLVEDKIRKSEEKLNYAQEIANMGSWDFDLRTRIGVWSKNLFKLMELDSSEFPLTIYEVYNMVHPEDQATFAEMIQMTENAVSFDPTSIRIILPSGKIKWLQIFIVPKFEDNELISLSGVNIDISHTKKIEDEIKNQNEKLNAIVNSIPDKLFVHDANGNYLEVYASDSDEIIIDKENFIGKNLKDIFGEEIGKINIDKIKECLSTQELVTHEFSVNIDNKPMDLEVRVIPFMKNKVIRFVRNITERKQTEREINKLTLAIEQSPVALVITDLNANIEYVSPAFETITGYKNSEIIGKNTNTLKSGKTEKSVYDSLWNTIKSGKTWRGEWINKKKDSSLYWESVSITPLVNGNKKVAKGYLAIKQDITERKKSEEDLIKSEKRFRSTLDNMIEGCQIIGNDWRYIYINAAAEKQNRRPTIELIGKNYLEVWPGIESSNVYMYMKKCLDEKDSHHFINEFEFPDGKTGWFELSIQSVPEGVFILSVDITDKLEANNLIAQVKERLDIATESAGIGTWDWDILSNKIVWDDRMYSLYGLKNGTNIFYNVWTSSIDSKDRANFKFEIQQALNNQKKYDTEFRVIWADESIHWLKANGQVFYDKDGKPIRMVGVNYDITQVKNSENEIRELNTNLEIRIKERTTKLVEMNSALLNEIEERKNTLKALNEAREEANKANVAKSEFLSRMSHELRTPLNSILGFAQLLEMGDLNPNQQKGVTHIMKSGKHLLDLINEVLDISRIEAGRLSLSPEPVQLVSVISETIDIVKPLANEKNINVELTESSTNELFIKADRQRLKQILINLINNGVKYNNEHGSVQIECKQFYDELKQINTIRIYVIDNGFGISEKNISNLFKPFERIGAEKTTIEGTGLGLAVALKLIEAMGGKLGVESKLNIGSTFWVEIPQCESQFEIAAKTENLNIISSDDTIKKGTILYVEDNIPNIELVEQVLSTKYNSVKLITTRFGKDGVKLAEENNPNLILLDLNLPDIHGADVLTMLQKNDKTKSLPVVVISADAMPQQLKRLLGAGAKHYLTKPLDVAEFLKIINKYIDS